MSPGRACSAALAAVLAAVLAAATPSPAASAPPDLDAQIGELRSLVRERRYPLALESLRLLARAIQELRLGEVSPAFPPPPNGWTAMDPVSLDSDEDPWTRRIEARREYRRDDGAARISVTLDLHSPWIPSVTLSLNPVFVAGDPLARLTDVAGERALVRFAPDAGDGDLRVIVGREVLVTLAGRGLPSDAPLLALARGIDFDLLRTRLAR